MTNIDPRGINGTTQWPYGIIYLNSTMFVHVGKSVATKYSAEYVHYRERNNIHSINDTRMM